LKTFDINHDQTKGSFVWLWAIEKEFDSLVWLFSMFMALWWKGLQSWRVCLL
jgi:hypothetical protein